jgi:F0F1-type ATP synthase membrane subunit c/vacuolar-type H+-ATPase subunit K
MGRSMVLSGLVCLVAGLGVAVAGIDGSQAQAQTPQRVVVFESFMRGV